MNKRKEDVENAIIQALLERPTPGPTVAGMVQALTAFPEPRVREAATALLQQKLIDMDLRGRLICKQEPFVFEHEGYWFVDVCGETMGPFYSEEEATRCTIPQ